MKVEQIQIPPRHRSLMTERYGAWLERRTLAFQIATSKPGGPANRFQYPSSSKS